MRVTLIVLFLLCFIPNFCIHTLGKRSKRIAEAPECDIKKHPSMVSIIPSLVNVTDTETNTTQHKYEYKTGVLITHEWVLTNSINKIENMDVLIIAGSTYELPGPGVELRKGAEFIYYSEQDSGDDTGLLLIKLDESLGKTNKISPAQLMPSQTYIDRCIPLKIVGWGASFRSEKTSKDLGDSLQCADAQRTFCERTNSVKFCFKLLNNKLMNSDDSGFGIFCGKFLVGVTTFPNLDPGGNPLAAGVNLSQYTKWLHKTTGLKVGFNGVPDRRFHDYLTTTTVTVGWSYNFNLNWTPPSINFLVTDKNLGWFGSAGCRILSYPMYVLVAQAIILNVVVVLA